MGRGLEKKIERLKRIRRSRRTYQQGAARIIRRVEKMPDVLYVVTGEKSMAAFQELMRGYPIGAIDEPRTPPNAPRKERGVSRIPADLGNVQRRLY